MKAFFEYIKQRITTRVPAIKTVRMFNNQLLHANEHYDRADRSAGSRTGYRNEKAFKYPACFVEFIVNETLNMSLGIKHYVMTVRFRFALESYKFERLETFDFCDDFDAAIQLMHTGTSDLVFTSFQEVQTDFDEDFTNVEAPYRDYRVRLQSLAGYQRKTDVPTTGVAIEVVESIEEPTPTFDLTFDQTFD